MYEVARNLVGALLSLEIFKSAPKSAILQFPSEIILQIASYLELTHIYALLQTSNVFYTVLRASFYDLASRHVYGNRWPATMLEWAAGEGYLSVIEEFRIRGRDQALSSHAKTSALCSAARQGHLHCVGPLLAMGADVSPPSSKTNHFTPLQWAARKGHLAIVQLLIEEGAELGSLGRAGITALDLALTHDEACAKALLEKASRTGRLGLAPLLLEKEIDVGPKDLDFHALVEYVFGENDMRLYQALCGHGVGASAKAKILLHIAIKNEHETALQLSLKLGADPSSAMFAGRTAYHETFRYHPLPIMRLFLRSRVDCVRISDQDTALHFAAYIADKELVLALLEKGASVSTLDHKGCKSLHYATSGMSRYFNQGSLGSRLRTIELLLERWARVLDANHRGSTALDYARRFGCDSIIQHLKKNVKEA